MVRAYVQLPQMFPDCLLMPILKGTAIESFSDVEVLELTVAELSTVEARCDLGSIAGQWCAGRWSTRTGRSQQCVPMYNHLML